MKMMSSMLVAMIALAVASPTWAAPNSKTKTPAVAVLPFKVLNAEPQWQHFGEGASDSIINKFVNDKALRVVEEAQLDKAVTAIARNQSGLFQEDDAFTIGQMVDARYIVIGSVQIIGDQQTGQVKVNARVLEVETRQLLLSEAVYGPLSSAFQQYDEIASRLSNKLTSHLAQRVNNNETADEIAVRQLIDDGKAYDPIFPATDKTKDLSKAIDMYNKALLRSPKSAKANLALGHAEFRKSTTLDAKDVKHTTLLKAARDHVRRATELDGQIPFAWSLLGRLEGTHKNHEGARVAFERALQLDESLVEARYGLAVSLFNLKSFAAARQQAQLAADAGDARGATLVQQLDAQPQKAQKAP
jgi:adenylate cyclase